jgi:hypothetical protein
LFKLATLLADSCILPKVCVCVCVCKRVTERERERERERSAREMKQNLGQIVSKKEGEK